LQRAPFELIEHSMSAPSELAAWDAVETRNRVRRRDVSVEEVVRAAIARAEDARPLGAVVEPTYERARIQARRPLTDGALAGVPTFIKDLAQIRGVPTTWGSRASDGCVSRRTDRFVTRFEQTGVITLGKSATPEFGLTATTEPLGRAPCRNPWDPSRSSGGSSGGAASLVASGVVPLAHASDGGGSIRIPAACCGVVGFKPSRFRMDVEGSPLLPINIATDGVITRTVRDTIAFHAAFEARRAPRRVASIGAVARRPSTPLRIGVFVDAPTGTAVHEDVRAAVLSAARLCEELGHRVDETPCPFGAAAIDDFLYYWAFVAWLQVRTARWMLHRKLDPSRIEPWTGGLVDFCVRDRRATLSAVRRLRGVPRMFAGVMRRYDVLLSPTLAQPAPPIGFLATDQPFETQYTRLRVFTPFTPLANTSGAPAISLPLGRTADGLPIGVQMMAAHGGDRTLLELATALEEARPWSALAPRQAWQVAA
jgi:amidase